MTQPAPTPQRPDPNARFKQHIANLLRARFPFLYLCTHEEQRALSVLKSVVSTAALVKTPRRLYVWSCTTGLVAEGKAGEDPATAPPLKALEAIAANPDPALFVLKDFHPYLGAKNRPADPMVVRRLRDLAPQLKSAANPKNVVFLSPELALPLELEKDINVVEFDLPDFFEIRELLHQMIRTNAKGGRVQIDLNAQEAEELVKAAQGLTLQEAENAFAWAMVEDGKLSANDVDLILEEKRQVIRKTEILEYLSPGLHMDDVGGLENLKTWMDKRNRSWLDAARRFGLPHPKGVLITGVPGCGKSLIAKALAASWRLPLLRMDVGRIFAGIVGSSEENMRRALQTAEAIAPSILWIDEIEKGFSGVQGAGGDSGTSQRVFGTFLTWMQEKTRPVFVAATANNISGLPPEMLRKGRFDEIFFVDLPTPAERRVIFRLHLEKRLKNPEARGEFAVNDTTLNRLADLSEGFVGAEIEQVVISALFEAFSQNRPLTLKDLEFAIASTVPLSVTQEEQIQALREWANLRAVSATKSQDRTSATPPPAEGEQDVRHSRGGREVDF